MSVLSIAHLIENQVNSRRKAVVIKAFYSSGMAAAISVQELEGGLYQGPSCVLAVMAEIVFPRPQYLLSVPDPGMALLITKWCQA